jgi:hypothetical protein
MGSLYLNQRYVTCHDWAKHYGVAMPPTTGAHWPKDNAKVENGAPVVEP